MKRWMSVVLLLGLLVGLTNCQSPLSPSSDKEMTAFGLAQPATKGVIDESKRTITLKVPTGTNLTVLVPVFSHTGMSVKPALGEAQDFTKPVTYTVTAADKSTRDYVVTVTAGTGGTASPPAGVTAITLGSAGGATATLGSSTGQVFTFVLDSLTNTTLDNLLQGNVLVTIASGPSITAPITCNVVSMTFSGGTAGSPVSVAMSLDRSGSMSSQAITDLETAAKSFVTNLAGTDQGAIVNFGSTVSVDQVLTSDKAALNTAIGNPLHMGGATALYDSIGTAISALDGATAGNRRAVISMTDGGENSSSKYTSVSSLVAFATSKGIPVYTVGLGTGTVPTNLQDIATGTGGVYYSAADSASLVGLYNKISSALNNFYTIEFALPAGTQFKSGKYTINVAIQNYGSLTATAVIPLNL